MSDLDYESSTSKWCPERPYGGPPSWDLPHVRSSPSDEARIRNSGGDVISVKDAAKVLLVLFWLQIAVAFVACLGALYFVIVHAAPTSALEAVGLVAGFGGVPALAIVLVLELVKTNNRAAIRAMNG